MQRIRKHEHILVALPPNYPGGTDICIICDRVILRLRNLDEPEPPGDPEVAEIWACVRANVRDPYSKLDTRAALREHEQHRDQCPHRASR